jgi:hypothetical protein
MQAMGQAGAGATIKAMFMVIFGAGASYDSVPSRRPSQYIRKRLFSRPPLANELFLAESFFAQLLARFPQCHPIVPYLQAAENLERTLETLQAEAETDPERKRQIAAIRFYLQIMIAQCENQWRDVSRRITNYVTILDQLRRCGPVLLVTFNYDTMIEDALPSVGISVAQLSHYIQNDAFKLFKLHGSVQWAHEVETPIELAGRSAWDIAYELIQRVGELQISDRYRMVVGPHPISNVDNVPLFPAIAIPVETKPGFECPSDHHECLRTHLERITKVLVVGWRATEKHFLDLFSSAVKGQIAVQVVAGQKNCAEEVLSHIASAGINVVGEALDGGFTEYVIRREAEKFFRN